MSSVQVEHAMLVVFAKRIKECPETVLRQMSHEIIFKLCPIWVRRERRAVLGGQPGLVLVA